MIVQDACIVAATQKPMQLPVTEFNMRRLSSGFSSASRDSQDDIVQNRLSKFGHYFEYSALDNDSPVLKSYDER